MLKQEKVTSTLIDWTMAILVILAVLALFDSVRVLLAIRSSYAGDLKNLWGVCNADWGCWITNASNVYLPEAAMQDWLNPVRVGIALGALGLSVLAAAVNFIWFTFRGGDVSGKGLIALILIVVCLLVPSFVLWYCTLPQSTFLWYLPLF